MLKIIEELCSFERRRPGSDAERRAANRFAERLRNAGREVRVEPIHVHPQVYLVWAVHCLLGFAGSLVAVASPPVGFAIVLLTATSLYLDLNTRTYLLRSLFFRRASQNVVSPGPKPTAPARLLLVAHLDTARTGYIFRPKAVTRLSRLDGWLPFPPSRIIFWSLASLLPMLGARMAGVEADLMSLLQIGPTLILLATTFLMVDVQFSAVVPGANDNASGVAVAMTLAADLAERPTGHLDVWVILSGGEECGAQGMRAFARANHKEFDAASTFVLAIDSVGSGRLRYVTSEGLTVSFEMDRRMVELCEAVAVAGSTQPTATPLAHGSATDALAARAVGWRATALTCLPAGRILPEHHHSPEDVPGAIDTGALERTRGFARDLIDALDADVARTTRTPG